MRPFPSRLSSLSIALVSALVLSGLALALPAHAQAPAPAAALSSNLMPRLSAGVPSPRPDAAGASSGGGEVTSLRVTEVTGELVTARGPVAGLRPMQFGRVVDAQGITVARVIVLRLLDQAVLASVMAGKERIAPGQALLFEQAPAPQAAPPATGH